MELIYLICIMIVIILIFYLLNSGKTTKNVKETMRSGGDNLCNPKEYCTAMGTCSKSGNACGVGGPPSVGICNVQFWCPSGTKWCQAGWNSACTCDIGSCIPNNQIDCATYSCGDPWLGNK
jgi:hypothetical protein